MARTGRTKVIYKGRFICIQTLSSSIFNYFQKDFEGCLEKAQKSSAFQLSFQKDGGLYFQHGHSRCLSNGNYDPIQCVDLSGDTDLWYSFFLCLIGFNYISRTSTL